uniref:Uncharacterized protein n=1 Tax=Brassica oleracea var. oleracea TaxID=109376 RepID=A0A0D3EE62_BRAOL
MEHHVKTCDGLVSVVVYGDQEKPALITYPNVALNYLSCFQGLFLCPEAVSLLLHNFCIYHISPPGHEVKNRVKEWSIGSFLVSRSGGSLVVFCLVVL